MVVDDENASAVARDSVPVSGRPPPWSDLPNWWWLVPLLVGGGGAAGYGIRKFPTKFPRGGGSTATGRQYAMGTFETPTDAEIASVGGVGFEPDVVLLRARPQIQAPADGDGSDGTEGATDGGTARAVRTAGLSVGAAVRRGEDIEQTVVAAADDAESVDAAVGAVHSGKALDVLVHGDDRVGSLAGAVTATTEDGFEMSFDASELPTDAAPNCVVHYQAFRLGDVGSVDVGYFTTPTGTGTQTVDLDVDADYLSLTACSLPTEPDAAAVGTSLGVSHGEAVSVTTEGADSADRIDQQAVAGGVAADAEGIGVVCGHDDRVLDIPFLDGERVVGRTAAWIRRLDERLELVFDSAHAPAAEPRIVTYLAMETGEGLRPELGQVEIPAPGAFHSVDVGFDPGMVGLTGLAVDRTGVDRAVPNAAPFDWSYGVAMPTVDEAVAEQVLHPSLVTDPLPTPPLPELGAIGPIHAGESAPVTGTPGNAAATDVGAAVGETAAATAGGAESPAPGGGSATNAGDESPTVATGGSTDTQADVGGSGHGGSAAGGDHSGPNDIPTGRGAAAMALATDRDGAIYGRDRTSVSSFTDTGFTVRNVDSHSRLDAYRERRRGVLFYTAWPKPTPGENRTSADVDEAQEDGS